MKTVIRMPEPGRKGQFDLVRRGRRLLLKLDETLALKLVALGEGVALADGHIPTDLYKLLERVKGEVKPGEWFGKKKAA